MTHPVHKAAGVDGVAIRLGAQGVSRRYGAVLANRDITLGVAPGEIHAIVGENGAGKSTLMRLLQGLEQPDTGTIIHQDEPIRLRDPQHALGLGIGMVHQEFMLAPDLSLLENFVLGDEPPRGGGGPLALIDWAAARGQGAQMAARAGIEIDWDRRGGAAPVHVRQYVEIFRLLRRGMRTVILDEPTAVLAPQQVDELFVLLRQLRAEGTSIVFISHKLHEVMALADRVTVMRRGAIIASTPVAQTDIDTLTGHIIGDGGVVPHAARTEFGADGDGAPLLSVTGLCAISVDRSHPLFDIDLAVHRGEIVGVAGVSGNGQDELAQCLTGLRAPASGTIGLAGTDLTGKDNAAFRRAGVGFVSPDRGHEGLARSATIGDNVMAASQRAPQYRAGPLIDLRAFGAAARERLARLNVRYGRLADPASSLSGGNQQRVVFAREIASDPRLMVIAQPTRGVDLGGIAAIHGIIRDYARDGGAVLVVSEEIDELIALCHRIVVMAEGRIVGTIDAAEATAEAIGRLMLQTDSGRDVAA
ncbi:MULTISPECIES: ABC transporter ATP-binding protein [unclassified Roseitalea]|uniref:ABC transporter ATP-binding protein n=1 Tax=unclassified Roseitalea TaxID=2639107 RepID=UPI00273DAC77|nr:MULTISPECIES: ABC transporter ATP-binding protein [unclassified Roseitalea]